MILASSILLGWSLANRRIISWRSISRQWIWSKASPSHFPDFNFKVVFFLSKTYLLRKIWQISDFSEYGVRRVQTVFQISMVEAGVNPRLLSYRTAYRPQRIFFKWNRSGSHCNRVGYHRKSWLSAFFWMFKRHMSSSKGSNVWITWYRVIYRTQTLLNTVQLWQLNRRIKTYQWHLRVFIATNITASLTDRRPITSRLNWPVRSISRV